MYNMTSSSSSSSSSSSLESIIDNNNSNNYECEYEYEYEHVFETIDVVWLKRDVRWHDHGPLSEVLNGRRRQRNKFIILYLYEPDQLQESTVHGSHVRFIHEGLIDMEQQLRNIVHRVKVVNINQRKKQQNSTTTSNETKEEEKDDVRRNGNKNIATTFEYLTVCHNAIISTLESIHLRYPVCVQQSSSSSKEAVATTKGNSQDKDTCIENHNHKRKNKRKIMKVKKYCYKIGRLLSHEETGHYQSYMRDRDVRKWCKVRSIPFVEYNQTGVTRRLVNRDDYLKHFKVFMSQPMYSDTTTSSNSNSASVSAKLPGQILSLSTPPVSTSLLLSLQQQQQRLIQLDQLPGFVSSPNGIANLFDSNNANDNNNRKDYGSGNSILAELGRDHRMDRIGREQYGGETKAIKVLETFLASRGSTYNKDISSPVTSWNSCSRLSPYLSWGHISLRYVLKCVQHRQEILRQRKLQGKNLRTPWLRSLQAFSSRIHWRSHFIQKLECEPLLEKYDLCSAYQHLRRQPDDWNEHYYIAWSTGKTGYPFVDACMRCLLHHGWLNFRMRAMLVSFATYNLWLDWKRIASHLGRTFLDYEPGIHYPQLQMQAGTTGINAMRVYNVTKQGKDQDPNGVFIRRFVKELNNVPDQYIHEPWKMSKKRSNPNSRSGSNFFDKINKIERNHACCDDEVNDDRYSYPDPIVDEKESAKFAKEKVNEVKKSVKTQLEANKVYVKHGSRINRRGGDKMEGSMTSGTCREGTLPSVVSISASSVSQNNNNNDPKGIRQSKINDIFRVKNAKATIIIGNNKNDECSNTNNNKKIDTIDLTTMKIFVDNNSSKRSSSLSAMSAALVDLTEASTVTNHRSKRLKEASFSAVDKNYDISLETHSSSFDARKNVVSLLPSTHDLSTFKTAFTPATDTISSTSASTSTTQLTTEEGNWVCRACTFMNDKPHGLICILCGTER